MSDDTVLIPEDEKTIEFYGDEVVGALVRLDGEARVYVPLRPICDYLGVSWSAQYERIQRDDVLADEVQGVRVTRTPEQGGSQSMLSLPLDMLPGWLFGISARRVKPALYERILRYRRECYRRLWDAWKHEILPSGETALAQPTPSGAALAYETATAVQHLARQQHEFEQRLGSRMDGMARFLGDFAERTDRRLASLELHLAPQAPLSDEQASELSLAVKAVGSALSGPDRKQNGYATVYNELYRRYRISAYKNLPRASYEEALRWLHAWHAELTDESAGGSPEGT